MNGILDTSSCVDVCYPFKPAYQNEPAGDWELFYSLRSVAKHLKGFRRIWILGSPPQFREPVGVPCDCIPVSDPTLSKQQNVRRKLLVACHTTQIADRFVLMNDDFYFLKDYEVSALPLFCSGTLKEHIEWREPNNPGSPYVAALKATERELRRIRLPAKDFELHVPLPVIKQTMNLVLDGDLFNWSAESGLCFRSLYGNIYEKNATRFPGGLDVKVDCPVAIPDLAVQLKDSAFLSTGPGGVTQSFLGWMKGKFLL
jgi:hypothetical protein